MARRALGLFGGGLDSRLAFRLLQDAGLEVEGVHFDTGFGRPAHRRQALQACERGEVSIVDVAQKYLETVVAAPRHGYGSGMNPCHDCRAFMLARADEIARARGIDLLFTGDVVGQRAHDQSHEAFRIADADGNVEGRVLRPLSASHLEEPLQPVAELASSTSTRFQGRSRRGQLALAAAGNVTDFATPSGHCCRLADPAFARRVRDYLEHRRPDELRADEIPVLAIGRHFRLAWNLKVILARNEREGAELEALVPQGVHCFPQSVPGPVGRIEGDVGDARDAASLVASYTPMARAAEVNVVIREGENERVVRATPADESSVREWRI